MKTGWLKNFQKRIARQPSRRVQAINKPDDREKNYDAAEFSPGLSSPHQRVYNTGFKEKPSLKHFDQGGTFT